MRGWGLMVWGAKLRVCRRHGGRINWGGGGGAHPSAPQQRALVETHLSRIRSLEQQLRQRDGGAFPGLSAPLPGQEVPFLSLHPNPALSHGEPPPHTHPTAPLSRGAPSGPWR